MAEFSGVVSNISSFDYQGKKLWSFQLGNSKAYFRTGNIVPKFQKGDFVKFYGTEGKNGNINVDTKSVEAKPAEVEQASSGVVGALRSGGSKDNYWEQREQRDIATQKRIERQSTRNSALEFMKLVLTHGEFKLPAKNKVEALEAMLSHYQELFLRDNSGEHNEKVSGAAEAEGAE